MFSKKTPKTTLTMSEEPGVGKGLRDHQVQHHVIQRSENCKA